MKFKKEEKNGNNQEQPTAEQFNELKTQLENLQKEKDETFAKLQRVSADFLNYEKRVQRQISDTITYEKEKIIKSLLPSLDNFEQMFKSVTGADNAQAVLKGVTIIYEHMVEILKSHGIEQIEALGQKFDPSIHEVLMRRSDESKEDNVVLEEYQKGYKLNGRTIRPSRVIVNKIEVKQQAEPKQQAGQSEAAGEQQTQNDNQDTGCME